MPSARVLLVAILVLAGANVAAQSENQDTPRRGLEMRPAEVQRLFDAMLVRQAQEALLLSEPQYAQFLNRLRVLQATRRRNQQERYRLIGELQRLTDARVARPDVADSDIQARLDALHELDSRAATELQRAYAGINEVLDVRQQARFRVFEEQIERRKLELIGRARQANPKRQNPPRKPPSR